MKRAFAAVVVGAMVAAPAFAAESGKAMIKPTREGSSIKGTAALNETADGVRVTVRINGAAPGPHAIHVHQFGECDDQGNAAGSHFNPSGAPHGFLPKDGIERAHAGDMGNIQIGENGSGSLDVTLPGVTLANGPNSLAGRAIILHEYADNFGQPTGNAGGRLGCGAIVLSDSTAAKPES